MNDIIQLKKQCQALKRDLSLLWSQHKSLFSSQLDDFKDERLHVQQLINENRELKFKNSQLIVENANSTENAFLREQNDSLTKQITQLSQQNDELKRILSTHEFSSISQIDFHDTDLISQLNYELDQVRKRNTVLSQKVDSLQHLELENVSILNERNQLKKQIRNSPPIEDSLTAISCVEFENVQSQLHEAHQICRSQQIEIDNLLSQPVVPSSRIENLKRQLVEANDTIQSLADEISAKNKHIRRLERKVIRIQDEWDQVAGDIAEEQRKLQIARHQIKAERDRNRRAMQELQLNVCDLIKSPTPKP